MLLGGCVMADTKGQSKKPEVILNLLLQKWPAPEETPWPGAPLVVSGDEIVQAIRRRNERHSGKGLSTRNPANFLKDFIRKDTCNTNWPQRLRDLRITARQRYGNELVMEFVPYREGDSLPFPNRFDPTEETPIYDFESLTIPREARDLGRQDEPWLTQVIVQQRIVFTHFSLFATKQGFKVESLAHLQMSVKTQPEIDTTFIATVNMPDDKGVVRDHRVYITGEAKQFGERILEDQIREQVAIAFSITKHLRKTEAVEAVLPFAFKVLQHRSKATGGKPRRGIYVAQFKPIRRSQFEAAYAKRLHDMPLELASNAFYLPHPEISGISHAPKKAKP